MNHLWPGNVRELRHCIERAYVLTPGTTLDPHLLFDEEQACGLRHRPSTASASNDRRSAIAWKIANGSTCCRNSPARVADGQDRQPPSASAGRICGNACAAALRFRRARFAKKAEEPPIIRLASIGAAHSQRANQVATAAPTNCATTNPGTSAGRIPAKVFVAARASVTAGLANDVEAVNQ